MVKLQALAKTHNKAQHTRALHALDSQQVARPCGRR
jgi:hypothetical protein